MFVLFVENIYWAAKIHYWCRMFNLKWPSWRKASTVEPLLKGHLWHKDTWLIRNTWPTPNFIWIHIHSFSLYEYLVFSPWNKDLTNQDNYCGRKGVCIRGALYIHELHSCVLDTFVAIRHCCHLSIWQTRPCCFTTKPVRAGGLGTRQVANVIQLVMICDGSFCIVGCKISQLKVIRFSTMLLIILNTSNVTHTLHCLRSGIWH